MWIIFPLLLIVACIIEFFSMKEGLKEDENFWEKYFEDAMVLYVAIIVILLEAVAVFLENGKLAFYVSLFCVLFCFYYFLFFGIPFLARLFRKRRAREQ